MREKVRQIFVDTIARCVALGSLPAGAEQVEFAVETPRNPAHGDFAVNAAMMLAKTAGMPPRAIAQLLLDTLQDADALLETKEIAGPGFINVRVDPPGSSAPSAWWRRRATPSAT